MDGLIELNTLINTAINHKPLFNKDLNDIGKQLQVMISGLKHITEYDNDTKKAKCPHCNVSLEDIYLEHCKREQH